MGRLDSRPRREERILAQRSKENLILLKLEDGQYYAVNRVGGRIWELCDGTRSVSEVVAIICQEYDTPAETVEADVLEILGDLISATLVVEDN